MKPELRTLMFCLTVLIIAPALYALGEWLSGLVAAVALPTIAVLATLAYARAGEREAPSADDSETAINRPAGPPPTERESRGAPRVPGAPPVPPAA